MQKSKSFHFNFYQQSINWVVKLLENPTLLGIEI